MKRPSLFLCMLFLSLVSTNTRGFAERSNSQVDLHQIGFFDLKEFRDKLSLSTLGTGQLSFVDDNTVGVAFLVRNDQIGLSSRISPKGSRFQLGTALLDFETGKIIQQGAWGDALPYSRLFPAPHGGFLLATSDRIIAYTQNLAKASEFSFPTIRGTRLQLIQTSFDGENIYGVLRDSKKDYVVALEGSTLKQLRTIELPAYSFEDALGTSVVSKTEHSGVSRIAYQSDSSQQMIAAFPGTLPACTYLKPVFIARDMLAIGGCHEVLILGLDGTVLFRKELITKGHLGAPVPSRNGMYFAFVGYEEKGGNNLLDIAPHVASYHIFVFDSSTHEQIYDVALSSEKSDSGVNLALSPDGSRLAYVHNGVVRFVDLRYMGRHN